MSLINDALKKAQKQRTGEAPSLGSLPSVGGESAAQISRRAKPGGFNTLLLRGGLGAGVVLILVVGGWFAFRGKPEIRSQKTENSAQTATPPSSSTVGSPLVGGPAPSSNPQASNPSSVVSPPSSGPAAPAFTLQIAPKTETPPAKVEVPTPQVSGFLPGGRPGQTPGSQQGTTAPAPASPPAKLEPRAMTFIENIKVAGIRASATDSKVLMNDRVYRIGDMVEHEMGLKLVGITSNSLTFEDERGGRFTRTF